LKIVYNWKNGMRLALACHIAYIHISIPRRITLEDTFKHTKRFKIN